MSELVDYTDILLQLLYYIKAIYLMLAGFGILLTLKLLYNFFAHTIFGGV